MQSQYRAFLMFYTFIPIQRPTYKPFLVKLFSQQKHEPFRMSDLSFCHFTISTIPVNPSSFNPTTPSPHTSFLTLLCTKFRPSATHKIIQGGLLPPIKRQQSVHVCISPIVFFLQFHSAPWTVPHVTFCPTTQRLHKVLVNLFCTRVPNHAHAIKYPRVSCFPAKMRTLEWDPQAFFTRFKISHVEILIFDSPPSRSPHAGFAYLFCFPGLIFSNRTVKP